MAEKAVAAAAVKIFILKYIWIDSMKCQPVTLIVASVAMFSPSKELRFSNSRRPR
jgi:hypothetical protein